MEVDYAVHSPRFESVPAMVGDEAFPSDSSTVMSGKDWVTQTYEGLDRTVPRDIQRAWRPPLQLSSVNLKTELPSSKDDPIEDPQIRLERLVYQLKLFRDASGPFFRRLKRLAALREDALYTRRRLDVETQNSKNHRTLLSEFQQTFLQQVQALLDTIVSKSSAESLRTLHEQAVEVQRRHDEDVYNAQKLEKQLADIESKMRKVEDKIRITACDMDNAIHEITLSANSGPTTVIADNTSSLSSEDPSIDMPFLVRHYFAKAGEANVEQSNLDELDAEYRRELSMRQLQRDQDKCPEVSDEAFDEEWLQRLAEAELSLGEAKEKRNLALAVCRGEGWNPEEYRKKSAVPEMEEHVMTTSKDDEQQDGGTPSSMAQDDSQDLRIRPRRLDALPLDDLDAEPSEVANPFAARPRRSKRTGSPLETRVKDWMESVPNGSDLKMRPISEASLFARLGDLNVSDSWTQETRPSRILKQRTSEASSRAWWWTTILDDARPPVIKRSSSESELFIFSSPSIRDRMYEVWKKDSIERSDSMPGQAPTSHPADDASQRAQEGSV